MLKYFPQSCVKETDGMISFKFIAWHERRRSSESPFRQSTGNDARKWMTHCFFLGKKLGMTPFQAPSS